MRNRDLWKEKIRTIENFPKPGIFFKDVTPLLQDPAMFSDLTREWARELTTFSNISKIAAIEARGFIFGAALAQEMQLGFVPIRKPGKLPAKTFSETYALEYGQDEIHMHEDALQPGDQVLIVDDVLATGGTAAAAIKLVERSGAQICALSFLVELSFLKGREKLESHRIHSFFSF